MEYYLVRLSYTPDAWGEILASTTTLGQRLEPVRKLLRHLGGSLATFSFFGSPHFADDRLKHDVEDKFAMFGGHDLLTVLAMPDRHAAQAFKIAIAAEPGLKVVDLTPMMPMDEAIQSLAKARDALETTKYAAPGRTKASAQ